METFGILETWSLRRGGCLQEVVATGGSTVVIFKRQIKREKYNYLIIKSEVVTVEVIKLFIIWLMNKEKNHSTGSHQ